MKYIVELDSCLYIADGKGLLYGSSLERARRFLYKGAAKNALARARKKSEHGHSQICRSYEYAKIVEVEE